MSLPFGAWLRSARQAQSLTLMELEERTGIAYTHISKMEHGKSRPSRDAVVRLAEALDADVVEGLIAAAFLPYGTNHFTDIETQKLAERYYRLPNGLKYLVRDALAMAEAAAGPVRGESEGPEEEQETGGDES